MYPTAEARWFVEGALPEEVVRWFAAVAGDAEWEERTDRYVRPSGPDGLGVKWRQGNAEVKRRACTVGEEALHERVTGRVERWRKWSFPLAERAALTEPGGDWVDVAKRRKVRDFAGEGAVRRVDAGAWSPAGCSLEVGEVRVGERTWWSVCFEAFGSDEAALTGRLCRIGRHVLALAEPPRLEAARSMGYPAWLVQEVTRES
ncbi:MAG: hypothetical protein R3362_07415 [Rhodothermales bacterium]|nr:hypothetical protein [Rhodothermales bacterium]